MTARRIDYNPAVFPHYVTPARVVGFLVVGPKLLEDARFEDEADALEEAAHRLANFDAPGITILRLETHLEVAK